jgi:hypothetical protein
MKAITPGCGLVICTYGRNPSYPRRQGQVAGDSARGSSPTAGYHPNGDVNRSKVGKVNEVIHKSALSKQFGVWWRSVLLYH